MKNDRSVSDSIAVWAPIGGLLLLGLAPLPFGLPFSEPVETSAGFAVSQDALKALSGSLSTVSTVLWGFSSTLFGIFLSNKDSEVLKTIRESERQRTNVLTVFKHTILAAFFAVCFSIAMSVLGPKVLLLAPWPQRLVFAVWFAVFGFMLGNVYRLTRLMLSMLGNFSAEQTAA